MEGKIIKFFQKKILVIWFEKINSVDMFPWTYAKGVELY